MLYLIAGNGAPNFGDELLVKVWLKFYRDSGYTGSIIVDGKGADSTRRLLREFENVEFRQTFIPRHKDGMEGNYLTFASSGIEFAKNNIEAFQGVKAIHLLGGGYTNSSWPNVMRLLGATAEISRHFGIPLVGTGLGFDPFLPMDAATRKIWSEIVGQFSFLECRDLNSWSKLMEVTEGKHWGLSYGLDDAFLYPVDRAPHLGRWLHLSGFSEEGIFGPSGRDLLPSLMEHFDKTVFWACTKTDSDLLKKLNEDFPQIERISNFQLIREGVPVEKNDFMLTSRFHPHLLASRLGLVGYYSYYSAFYKTKHEMVADLGSAFRKIEKTADVFQESSKLMLAGDIARVNEKQRVAKKILWHLSL